jgi:hypothetical protein
MKKYYFLAGKNLHKCAFADTNETFKLHHILIPELEGKTKLPFEFHLIKLTIGRNGLIMNNDLSGIENIWLDYIPNCEAWPLMSENLRAIIIQYLTGDEGIDWIEARVNTPEEYKCYYIPRFNKRIDVLDEQDTLFVKGTDHVIRPSFASNKIEKYNMFIESSSDFFWKITSGIYVSEDLKKAIQKEKMTGLTFELTRVSQKDND